MFLCTLKWYPSLRNIPTYLVRKTTRENREGWNEDRRGSEEGEKRKREEENEEVGIGIGVSNLRKFM